MGAVIVAAGASRRLGSPKALLLFEGETFIGRLARHFQTVAEKVVVVCRPDLPLAVGDTVSVVENPDPERGMLSSLQCGLRTLAEAENVIFSPVDYASVQLATIVTLTARHSGPLTLPTFHGKRGHPAIISRPVIEQLLELDPTGSPKTVIYSHLQQACLVPVDDARVVEDVDTIEDYLKLVKEERR